MSSTSVPKTPLVVGIGASAGGSDALRSFFRSIPAQIELAFVVVLHLDPGSKSLLPSLLDKSSPLSVVEITDGLRIEANRIYTAPPSHLVAVERGVLKLYPPARPEDRRTVIDRFFTSLARDQGERAVGIILSGTGSDGSLGLRAIAENGGLTMVQEPSTAEHESMPRIALDTAGADHVLPVQALAEELAAYAKHVEQRPAPGREADSYREVEDALPKVCELLLQATGHNFKHYKTSTITRRTLRRIQVLRLAGVREYLECLRTDPGEADRLFKELLINVTAFFRDPEAFAVLADEVLPRLLENRSQGDCVRMWVPGCATGEEAYSLAMLMRERLDGVANPPEVQIFATDIDEESLATARQGSYPLGIADEITAPRLARFFVKKAQQYHVAKAVRELILFSNHNLINDPPFSRLDLISCRNLLIYLGSHLQKKLIPLFHYALRPGGHLFLGPSENLSTHRELFRPIDAKHRISLRLPTAIRSALPPSGRYAPPAAIRPANAAAPPEPDTYLVMQRIVLDEFSPKAVVVNEEGQIVCASGNAEKYLTVNAGAFHNNVSRLVRDGLRIGLRTALAEATETRRKVVHEGLSLRTEAGIQRVMLTVQPMPQLGEDSGLFMVVFHDVGLPLVNEASPDGPPSEAVVTLIEQLERELLRTREDLEKTVQELEAANEELKSSNEELLSMNEELQSSNEELETSKEEVQSANDALAAANGDLENLFASTRIATIFLDDSGSVRRATTAASAIFNILPTDTGRPLDHFTHKAVSMPPLPETAAIFRNEKPHEDEFEMRDGAWYLRRVLPYRTADGATGGIVLTFTDITERVRLTRDLARRAVESETLLKVLPVGIGIAEDRDCLRIAVNPAMSAMLAVGAESNASLTAAAGDKPTHFKVLRDGREVDPADLPLQVAARDGTEIRGVEFEVVHADGRRVHLLEYAAPLFDERGRTRGSVGAFVDITERIRSEGELFEANQRLQTLMNALPVGVSFSEDTSCTTITGNEVLMAQFGTGPQDNVSASALEETAAGRQFRFYRDGREVTDRELPLQRAVSENRRIGATEFEVELADGRRWFMEACAAPIRDAEGRAVAGVAVTVDITERKRTEEAVRMSELQLSEIFRLAPSFMCVLRGPEYVFERANEQYYELIGRRDILGKSVLEALPEVADQAFPALLDEVFRSGVPRVGTDVSAMLRPAPGLPLEEHSIDFVYQPLFDTEGAVTGILVQGLDLTGRKRAQAELGRLAADNERQRRMLDTVLSNAPDLHYVFDVEGRFTFANKALLAVWGKELSEIAGKSPHELDYTPELATKLRRQVFEVVATREPLRDVTPYHGMNGLREYEYIFVPVFAADGTVECVAGSTRDMTEARRDAETLRLQALSLQEVDRRKDVFLATLAHELRNPLAPVRSGLQVLRKTDEPGAAEKIHDMMDRQLVHMVRLIDDLLDISRISTDKVTLRLERVALRTICEIAVEASLPTIEQARHTLAVEIPDEPIWLNADVTRAAQIVVNLLTNAAKYTPEGGRIRLSVGRDAGWVSLAVQDSGLGIPAGMLAEVFQIFTQVNRTLERAQGGLGIGLALVKKLVELHGGTVAVESPGTGRGSTFTVRWPEASAGLAPPTTAPELTRPTARKLRVLVIDDNEDAADSLAMMIELDGHEIRTVYNGGAALELAGGFRPDLVICDIGLPQMDGYEVARRLRLVAELSATVLVALTGWGSQEDKRKTKEAGFDHHLIKPAEAAEIDSIIRSVSAKLSESG